MSWHRAFIALCIIATAHSTVAYNLADKLPIFKFGPVGSKFGFSVAMHKINGNNQSDGSNVYLMAGAPTASSEILHQNKTGAVFYCPVTTYPSDCRRVDISMEDGEENGIRYVSYDQWLGVSLKSEGPGKNLVTCAHRYKRINLDGYGTINEKYNVRMCGRCVLMKTSDVSGDIVEIPGSSSLTDPCRDKRIKSTWTSKSYYGYPLAGVSIAIDEGDYYLGAPGTYSYTGAVFRIHNNTIKRSPTCEQGPKERFKQPSGRYQCTKIPVTTDSYLGFSLATSSALDVGSDTTYYIAGAPRANETGAVLFFTRDVGGNLVPDVTKSLYGDLISSGFGYAIATTDINNDGLDDLIIGSPQYLERSSARKVDGAVYIYLNIPGVEFRELDPLKFYGSIDSYFGHSVAALGDIDRDGFNDFAVGAPFEDGGVGIVFIYRGGKNSPVKSQVIRGLNYKSFSPSIIGFGSSLSAEVDVDSNGYPDLLVGTSSDGIALFRSRPIITLAADLVIKSQEVDLGNKSCSVGDKRYSCFEISFCFSFSSNASDEFPEGIRVQYTLLLDSIVQKRKGEPRVRFRSPKGGSTVTNMTTIRTPDTEECLDGNPFVYVRNRMSDKLTPIEIRFKFDIDQPENESRNPGDPIADMSKYPILDGDSDRAKTATIPIKNTCGEDGCQSDLNIDATMPDEIVLGKDEEITVTVFVSNDGEEAHQAVVDIHLPKNLGFIGYDVDSNEDVGCQWSPTGESSFIICDMGNPFGPGSNATMNFHLATQEIDQDTRSVIVSVTSHTTSENPEILPISLNAEVVVEVDLQLSQYAEPEQIRYSESPIKGETGMASVEEIGPPLKYTFSVLNKGSARSSGINLVVDIPVEIYNHKWLLYLVSSEVSGRGGVAGGSCNSSFVNTLGLNVAVTPTRRKRDTEGSQSPIAPRAMFSRGGGSLITTVSFSCRDRDAHCISLECYLDTIEPASSTFVTLQFRMWEATLLEEYKNYDLVYVKTEAQLTTSDSGIRFKRNTTTGMVMTTVDHDEFTSEVTSSFPWWYILIAIIFLVLLYIIIVVILLRCGFFSRKKFNREEEDKRIEEEKRSTTSEEKKPILSEEKGEEY